MHRLRLFVLPVLFAALLSFGAAHLSAARVAADAPTATPTIDQYFPVTYNPYNPYYYSYYNYFPYNYYYYNYYRYNYYNPYLNYFPYSYYNYYRYNYYNSYYNYNYNNYNYATWKWCTIPGDGSRWVYISTPPAGWFCSG